MIKNSVFKKFTAILLAAAYVLSFSAVLSAENASGAEQSDADKSYSSYYSQCSSQELADSSVKADLNVKFADSPIEFTVEAPKSALYNIGLSYMMTEDKIGDLELGIKINGKYPFSEAEAVCFPHMWMDETDKRIDDFGNEFSAKQVPFDKYYFNIALDVSKKTDKPYLVFLKEGINKVTLLPVSGKADLEYFCFGAVGKAEAYVAPDASDKMYSGKNIVIEAEKSYVKSSYWLSSQNDNTSINVSPNSASKSVINFIGGDNWKTVGETIVWETPELEAGYYRLGTSFRQSAVIGGRVYRKLTVDGKVPFAEAETVGFEYDDSWQSGFFADDKGNPYLIYFTEGKHLIGLTVTPGRISEVQEHLEKALSEIGSLYIDMTMIVGETVDMYRDYELFEQITDMDTRLEGILEELKLSDKILKEITGEDSGSNSSVIKSMMRVIQQMIKNRYTAHRYKSEYYNKYTALAAVLYEMQNMPLDIDKLVLTAPEQDKVYEKAGVFKQLFFSVQKFIYSFVNDYNDIQDDKGDSKALTVWVNWGRDQVQVLNSLIQTSYTPQTGVPVSVKLVNASIVQAILSGNGPDCILQRARTEPVDLAMRGVLVDLTEFDDLDDVLKRFRENVDLPYRYNGGLYALPDTQTFFLMFYRKDILEQLDISLPKTWNEFKEVAKLLSRNNLNIWIPNNPVTDLNQASNGIGSINIFPSMLMQKGLNIYSDDGRSTRLSDMDVMVTFGEWTDMYRKLKLPTAIDFYNRFRTGTCPIGISSYTLYTTLKAAAPEIEGLWAVAPIPGTELEDGSINASSAGAGSACAILKGTSNSEGAWEFLKWWTSAETQLSYSNEVEAILGSTGRVAVANVDAFKEMDWDSDMLGPILEAWSQVREIPEYPGSYYVSRSLYQSFWNVVENNRNPKDMLIKYGKQADIEIERKWKQYENKK